MFPEIPVRRTRDGPWFRPVIGAGQLIHAREVSLLTSALCWTACKVYDYSMRWIHIPELSLKWLTTMPEGQTHSSGSLPKCAAHCTCTFHIETQVKIAKLARNLRIRSTGDRGIICGVRWRPMQCSALLCKQQRSLALLSKLQWKSNHCNRTDNEAAF